MATRKKKAAKRRPRKVDFDDQDAVLVEVAKHLEIDPDELRIEESTDLTNFGDFDGVVYRIYFRGDRTGGKEWKVIENHDKMYDLAIQVVTQDLEEEPENFNKEFIEHHINTDRLRRELESDVQTMAEEDLREMSSRQFWQTAERYLDSVPEEDGEGENGARAGLLEKGGGPHADPFYNGHNALASGLRAAPEASPIQRRRGERP